MAQHYLSRILDPQKQQNVEKRMYYSMNRFHSILGKVIMKNIFFLLIMFASSQEFITSTGRE